MKVLLVEIWTHGGTAQYAAELARALDDSKGQGDSVDLIAPREFAYDHLSTHSRAILPALTGGNSRYRAGRAAVYLSHWIGQQLTMGRLLSAERPDVVHFLGTPVA